MTESTNMFVGRSLQLRKSNKIIDDHSILNVYGPGGIGKTCFLKQLVRQSGKQANRLFIGPLDLGRMKNQSRKSILLHVVEQLDRQYFAGLFEALASFANMDPYQRPGLWDRVFSEFLSGYENYKKHFSESHHVFLFDTYEAIEEREVGNWLVNKFIPYLGEDVGFVIAGRNPIPDTKTPMKIVPMQIKRLSDSECKQYVDARLSTCGLGIMDESSYAEILRLSEGIPILLVLATDWYLESGKHWTPDSTRDDFEYSVVAWIRDLKDPLESLLLLAMAAFNIRFDVGLVSELLSVKKEAARAITNRLSRFAFTKSDRSGHVFGLHDEMRRMIQTHIALPPKITKDLAALAADYFESRLSMTPADHTEDILARIVYFRLLSNPDEGREEFERAFTQALHTNRIDHARLLLRVSEDVLVTGFADGDTRTTLARAQIYVADWQPQQAHLILEILEQIGSVDSKTAITVLTLITKARALLQEARPTEAMEVLEEALVVSRKLDNKPYLVEIYSLLGFTCQSMGLYQDALHHQKHALAVAQSCDDLSTITAVVRSQAECHRRLGRASEALEYAEYGMTLAHQINDEGMEIQTLIQKAKILRDERRFEDSESIFLDLIDRLAALKKPKVWTASVYQEIAWLYLLKGDLEKSRSYARKCIELCDALHYLPEKPAALHTLFHALMEEEGVESGESLILQCYTLAKKVVDIFFVFNALEHMSKIAYTQKNYGMVSKYRAEMETYQDQGYQFPLFFGRVNNTLGDISFEAGKLDEALVYYLDGYALIAQAGVTSSPKSVDREFDILARRFDMLSKEEADMWTQRFELKWQQDNLEALYPRLVSICRLTRLKHDLGLGALSDCGEQGYR